MAEDDKNRRIADEILMQQIAQEDEKALQVLYGRYAPFLHHLALRSLDADTAEDIVQEVFFLVWSKADDFDPARGSFRNWVLQITHFRILNELRRRSRRPFLTAKDSSIFEEVDERLDSPPEQTWKKFREKALQEAVDRLPTTQRQALRLAFFEELSHEEVAEALGLPLGTVKGRIRLALRKLRGGLIPLTMGLLVFWGLGTSVLAYRSLQDRAVYDRALSFVTRSDIEVKKLASVNGVAGTCSYATGKQTVVLGLSGLRPPKPGQVYRFWANWGGNWALVGDLTWKEGGRGLLETKDPRWSREPVSVLVTLEDVGNTFQPSGPRVVETSL